MKGVCGAAMVAIGQQVVSRITSFECLFLQRQLVSDAGVVGIGVLLLDCRRLSLLICRHVGELLSSSAAVLLVILHWGSEWALVVARHLAPLCIFGEFFSLLLPMLSASVLRSHRMLVIAG